MEFRHLPPLAVAVIGVMSAAVMLMICHCIVVNWCSRQLTRTGTNGPLFRSVGEEEEEATRSFDSSFIQLIPACKYAKGLTEGGGDGTCAVCLCEFKEGEHVRRMPECLHAFHVPCIDMWLFSHANCPLCRSDLSPLTPTPLLPSPPPPNFGG